MEECEMELEGCVEDLDLTLNDSKKTLATLIRLFPVILELGIPQDKQKEFDDSWLYPNLVTPFLVRSKKFCNKRTGISFESTKAGGFSSAGEPKAVGRPFRLRQISFSHTGGWNFFWTETFAKVTHPQRASSLKAFIQNVDRRKVLVLSDPLYEGMVSAFLSNLYDLGVLPCFSKVFGSELCPVGEDKYSSTVIMEKSGEEIKQYITQSKFSQATKGDFAIWFCNLFTDLQTAKDLIGFFHGDLHTSNVLLKKVGSPNSPFPGKVERAMYDGRYYDETMYIVREIPGIQNSFFVVENNGLLPKVIDYGLSVADFSISNGALFPDLKEKKFSVSNQAEVYALARNATTALLNFPGLKNFEVVFFLLTFLFEVEKRDRGVYGEKAKVDREIVNFCLSLLALFKVDTARVLSPYIKKLDILSPKDKRKFWFNDRNVGSIAGAFPCVALASLLPRTTIGNKTYFIARRNSQGFSSEEIAKIITDKRTMFIPILPLAFSFASNSEAKFRTEIAKYAKVCVRGKDVALFGYGYVADKANAEKCKEKLVGALKDDSEFLLPKKTQISPTITNPVPFDTKDSLVFKSAVSRVFSRSLFPRIQGGITKNLKYEKYQRMLNFLPPPASLVGKPMRLARVSLVSINPLARCSLDVGKNLQKVITSSTLSGKSATATNGGYFIVNANIKNVLTPGLSGKELFPIGYYYDGTRKSGTHLPVPPGYREWFVAVTVKNGKLGIERLPEFEEKHETIDVPFRIAVGNEILELQQKAIVLDGRNKPKTYDSCFTTGPVLVWNGTRIFDEKVMTQEKFILPNGKEYRVVFGAKNNKKFFSEPGETSFPYGQRHSANFQVHNILLEFMDGNFAFFFVEGRGYDAPGLDRAQISRLLVDLFPGKLKTAVSLDGGFSANAVFTKNYSAPYWLMNDPEKRKLGVSLLFVE